MIDLNVKFHRIICTLKYKYLYNFFHVIALLYVLVIILFY